MLRFMRSRGSLDPHRIGRAFHSPVRAVVVVAAVAVVFAVGLVVLARCS